jgi:hypothetical protein
MAGSITSLASEGVLAAGSGNNVAFVTLSHTTQVTQKGQYRIKAYVSLYGTAPTAADANNVKLVVGSTSQILPIPAAAGPGVPYEFYISLDGNTDVVLQSATAGPSVATYSGMLVAEYLGSMGQLRR